MLIALTMYSLYTSQEFTFMRLLVFLMAISGSSAAAFSSQFSYEWPWLPVISGLSATIFGSYVAYDTQLIASGNSHSLSQDDYIIAALLIYVDILMLFLEFLKLFGGKGSSQ